MYRSQAVVMDTSAYDLERIGALPEFPEITREREREQDRRQRERRREAIAPPSEETRARVRARQKTRAAERQGISRFAVAGYLVTVLALTMVVLAHVELTVVSGEIVQLEQQLSVLQEEHALLQVAYGQTFSQVEIERFAREELGMMEAAWSQIGHAAGRGGDTVEILALETERQGGFLGGLAGFFGSLVEYLPFGS